MVDVNICADESKGKTPNGFVFDVVGADGVVDGVDGVDGFDGVDGVVVFVGVVTLPLPPGKFPVPPVAAT